jgi:hypothetical protein
LDRPKLVGPGNRQIFNGAEALVATSGRLLALSHAQAEAKAKTMVALPQSEQGPLTVRQAWDRYVAAKRNEGRSVADLVSRATCHILPALGDLVVKELTIDRLRLWLATVARTPVQMRSSRGKPNYRGAPVTDEQQRARKVSANRVLTMLKACLNFSYNDKLVDNRDAWGRRLKPFKDVAAARVRFLTVAEAQSLINACDPEFRPLVQAALETGCRYGEIDPAGSPRLRRRRWHHRGAPLQDRQIPPRLFDCGRGRILSAALPRA